MLAWVKSPSCTCRVTKHCIRNCHTICRNQSSLCTYHYYCNRVKSILRSHFIFQLSGHVKQQCGKPGEAIIEASKEEGASMLILGTRGMGLVRRTLVGSVSDYCLHHSDVPVLICRHKTPKHSKGHHS